MIKIKTKSHSHFFLILFLTGQLFSQAFAESTPYGVTSTYELNGKSYTYYFMDGTPIPPGARFYMTMAGGVLINAKGESIGQMYASKEEAAYFTKRLADFCANPMGSTGAGSNPADSCKPFVRPDVYFPDKAPAAASIAPKTAALVATAIATSIMAGINAKAYNAQSLEVIGLMWGISEVGEKLCKSVGPKYPKSLESFWVVVKDAVAAEKERDLLDKKHIALLKTKTDEATADKSNSSALQLKAIELQIEALNSSIDSLSGSALFSLDPDGGKSKASARIPRLVSLLESAKKSAKQNDNENQDNHNVYNACTNAALTSKNIAQDACQRKKLVSVCTMSGESNQDCHDEENLDPVPGSCDVAKSSLLDLDKGPLIEMRTLYYINPIPSKLINEQLIRLGTFIDNAITALPVSNDKNYNWNKPLVACQEKALMTTIKGNGMVCPANAADNSYDKAKVDQLGSAEDPAMKNTSSITYVFPGDEKITENANSFLTSMGISGDDLTSATKKFKEDWNTTDMYVGQPIVRQTYFKKAITLLTDMISTDKAQLATMNANRDKLIKQYDDTKKLFK
jgi:hypothetical protein